MNGRASGHFLFGLWARRLSEVEFLEGANLFENLGFRVFRLSKNRRRDAVSCDADGVFVGPVPLLKRARLNCAAQAQWIARREAEINEKLTLLYGLPIDVTSKTGGIETIARALNDGKVALAKIAAVQLQFPDPPLSPRSKEFNLDRLSRAADLYRSGLLKADDDWDALHPRTGTKPNPGWFAPKPEGPKPPSKLGWALSAANKKAKAWIAKAAEELATHPGRLVIGGLPLVDAISTFIETLTPTELNGGEDRLVAQMKANYDPPKTLEQLQQAPTDNVLGYEQHHIVEQTDANVQKDIELLGDHLQKFGRDMIDDPSNIVWVPRLKHELISADYSSNVNGPGTPTLRQGLSQSDFATQRAAGLEELRKRGVLK